MTDKNTWKVIAWVAEAKARVQHCGVGRKWFCCAVVVVVVVALLYARHLHRFEASSMPDDTGSGAEDKSSDSNRRENSLAHSSQLRIRIYLRDDKRCLEELTKEGNVVVFHFALRSFRSIQPFHLS